MGPTEQLFVVHRDLICASSKFFKAACSTRWIEGQESKVRLYDVKPKFFQSYVAWLLSGHCQLRASEDDIRSVIEGTLDEALELYLLGDVLKDTRFRNKMMEIMVTTDVARLPTVDTLCKFWNRTPSNSMLRKMYVGRFMFEVNKKSFSKKHCSIPCGIRASSCGVFYLPAWTKHRRFWHKAGGLPGAADR